MYNFKLQKIKFKQFIDNITIEHRFFRNFASIKYIRRIV